MSMAAEAGAPGCRQEGVSGLEKHSDDYIPTTSHVGRLLF